MFFSKPKNFSIVMANIFIIQGSILKINYLKNDKDMIQQVTPTIKAGQEKEVKFYTTILKM